MFGLFTPHLNSVYLPGAVLKCGVGLVAGVRKMFSPSETDLKFKSLSGSVGSAWQCLSWFHRGLSLSSLVALLPAGTRTETWFYLLLIN